VIIPAVNNKKNKAGKKSCQDVSLNLKPVALLGSFGG